MPRHTPLPPLHCDASGIVGVDSGPTAADFAAVGPQLAAARERVLADAASLPAAGFLALPDRLLADYQAQRSRSLVHRLMKSAQRLAARVDRVVVLGAGGLHLGPRAVMDACCHPFHNDLSRGQRGGHPRLYFAGHDLDNDRTHGLLDLLRMHRPALDLTERWGLVILDQSGRRLETALARHQFLAALRASCGGDEHLLGELVIPVIGPDADVTDDGLACADVFRLPDGVPARATVLTAAGLLPAALLGLDVVKLLEGAAAMNGRFRDAPLAADGGVDCGPQGNPVLSLAAAGYLMSQRVGATLRLLTAWHSGLEATGWWYESLLAETLPAQRSLTAIYPRDAFARLPQPPAWAIHLTAEQAKQDRLRAGPFAEQDRRSVPNDRTWPQILAGAIAGVQSAEQSRGIASVELRLPRLDEASLGQLWQLLILAAAVEGQLGGFESKGSGLID